MIQTVKKFIQFNECFVLNDSQIKENYYKVELNDFARLVKDLVTILELEKLDEEDNE